MFSILAETISRIKNVLQTFIFYLMIWVHYKKDLKNLFCFFIFLWFFDGYYIARTDLDQNMFSINCGNITYFFSTGFGPSPSPNFNSIWKYLCYPSSGIGCSEYPYTYIHFWELICTLLITAVFRIRIRSDPYHLVGSVSFGRIRIRIRKRWYGSG